MLVTTNSALSFEILIFFWQRFAVYKKHYPPALHDEVWRLDRIAKDGVLHKKLLKANIGTVEDFLRLLVKDPQKLRNVSIFFCLCEETTNIAKDIYIVKCSCFFVLIL